MTNDFVSVKKHNNTETKAPKNKYFIYLLVHPESNPFQPFTFGFQPVFLVFIDAITLVLNRKSVKS